MVRVLYDYQVFAWQHFGGISRYFYELARRVAHTDAFRAKVIAPIHCNAYLREGGVPVAGMYGEPSPRTARIFRGINKVVTPLLIRLLRPDIVHETYYRTKTFAPSGCKTVITVFDMIHERFPSWFPADDRTSDSKRTAVARADLVICISEHTRRDLIELFNVDPTKLKVIYLGFTLTASERSDGMMAIDRPFLLYVGSRTPYKNFSRLVTAFASSPILRREFVLVAFGGGDFNPMELKQARELGLNGDSIRHVAGSDAVLAGLYRRASLFVCPSLYEGFGIPPLEAMSFDCPVVCSNTSSLPEVVGDAARLFDPTDVDAMRIAIEDVVMSSATTVALIESGRERVKRFSWDRCATETMQAYRELAR